MSTLNESPQELEARTAVSRLANAKPISQPCTVEVTVRGLNEWYDEEQERTKLFLSVDAYPIEDLKQKSATVSKLLREWLAKHPKKMQEINTLVASGTGERAAIHKVLQGVVIEGIEYELLNGNIFGTVPVGTELSIGETVIVNLRKTESGNYTFTGFKTPAPVVIEPLKMSFLGTTKAASPVVETEEAKALQKELGSLKARLSVAEAAGKKTQVTNLQKQIEKIEEQLQELVG